MNKPLDCDGNELSVGDWVMDSDQFPYEVTQISEGGRSIRLDNFGVWFFAKNFKKITKPVFPFLNRFMAWVRKSNKGGADA